MCIGFWAVESVVPSFWKSHAQDVGFPEDVSVNRTVRGACPDEGVALNEATGAVGPDPATENTNTANRRGSPVVLPAPSLT
jgi:hypothetical protein